MAEQDWSSVLLDLDSGELDCIIATYEDNPRRGSRMRDDIVTVETVPTPLQNGDYIKWWGIADGSRYDQVKIWAFEDDETMSDHGNCGDDGWEDNQYVIYSDESGEEDFSDGLAMLRAYIEARQNGETVG